MTASSDPIGHAALFSTLERSDPIARPVRVMDGKCAALDTSADLTKLAEPQMQVIDPDGWRVQPGLIDNHPARRWASLDAALPPTAMPDGSSVRQLGGHGVRRQTPRDTQPSATQSTFALDDAGRHARVANGPYHGPVWSAERAIANLRSFSGFCPCWAI